MSGCQPYGPMNVRQDRKAVQRVREEDAVRDSLQSRGFGRVEIDGDQTRDRQKCAADREDSLQLHGRPASRPIVAKERGGQAHVQVYRIDADVERALAPRDAGRTTVPGELAIGHEPRWRRLFVMDERRRIGAS